MSAGSMGVEYKEPTIEDKVKVLWSKYIRDYEKESENKLSVLEVMELFEKEFECSGLGDLNRSFAWLGFLGAYQQLNLVEEDEK